MDVVNSGQDWLVFCGCSVIVLECYVIVVDGFNARFFSENEILFGGVEKTGLFCDVEKTDWLSGVLESSDEALLVSIVTDGSSFAGVTNL